MKDIGNEITQGQLEQSFSVDPYNLTEAQFKELEERLLAKVDAESDQQAVHAVWMRHDSEFASLVRTLESAQFPEIADVMEPFENQSVFLALVDNRPDATRIVHAFRLTSLGLAGMEIPEGDTTGVALLDDIADSEQGVTASQIKRYYEEKEIDLTKCVSVETNFRVGEKVATETGLPVSQLGYLAIFRALERMGIEENKSAVFAHLNVPAVSSLSAVGIEWNPIVGRDQLKTPTVDEDGSKGFDIKYTPVEIPGTARNMQVFRDLMPFAAPEVYES